MRLKLKAICFDIDFRCSERTNYDKFRASGKFPGVLRTGEVFLFLSRGGDQLVWLINAGESQLNLAGKKARIYEVTDSRKWRISRGGTWNPMMLANYAEEVGIELIGIKKFEVLYNEHREARLAERRKAAA